MKRTTKHVFLDAHQASKVASVREESGRIIQRAIVATEEAALVESFAGIAAGLPVHCQIRVDRTDAACCSRRIFNVEHPDTRSDREAPAVGPAPSSRRPAPCR